MILTNWFFDRQAAIAKFQAHPDFQAYRAANQDHGITDQEHIFNWVKSQGGPEGDGDDTWFESASSWLDSRGGSGGTPSGSSNNRPDITSPPTFNVQAGGLDFRDAAAVKAKMDAGWVPNAEELAAIKNAQELQAHHDTQKSGLQAEATARRNALKMLDNRTDEERGIGKNNDLYRGLSAGIAGVGTILSGGRTNTANLDFGKSTERQRRESKAEAVRAAIEDAQKFYSNRSDELTNLSDKIASLAGEGRVKDIARADMHQQDIANNQLTAATNQQQTNFGAAQMNAANNWQADMQKWQMAENEAGRKRAMEDMTNESLYQILRFNGVAVNGIDNAKAVWNNLPAAQKSELATKAGQYLTSMNTGRGAFSQFMTNNVTPALTGIGQLASFMKPSSEKNKEFKKPESKPKKPAYLERLLGGKK